MEKRRRSRLPLATRKRLLEHFVAGGERKGQGRVHAVVILNACSQTLLPIIRRKISPDPVVHSDALGSYDVPDVFAFHEQRTASRDGTSSFPGRMRMAFPSRIAQKPS